MQADIVELINRASKAAGSDNKLAKLIDAPQPHISQWRNGNRPCPPADIALMASVAGLSADEWLVRAVLAKHEGTAKGDKLMRVLKASLATGAAIGSGSAMAASTAYGMISDLLRCIFCDISYVKLRPAYVIGYLKSSRFSRIFELKFG